MKKIFLIVVIFALALITLGCSSHIDKSYSGINNEIKEKSLNYMIEKITLSKGFQALDPSVEILDKTNNLKLLANIGLIESSGVRIDKITKTQNTINIFVSSLQEEGKTQLAVPKVVLELRDTIDEKIENLKFNIINQNYDLIPLKFNKDQILDKIYTDFKIEPNSIPEVTLGKLRNQIYWNIIFTNIFDKENRESPLINFNIKVDALTGTVLSSTKEPISTYIDNGILLDYIPNSYLLYKQSHAENNMDYEALWIYDLEKEEQNKLYSSKAKIQSAQFSPDGKWASIIEKVEDKTDLYLISIQEKIAYKINPDSYLHPKLMKWKDNKTLIFINMKNGYSNFLTYDLDKNEAKQIFKTDKNVDSFDIYGDMILFTEPRQDLTNKNIYIYDGGNKYSDGNKSIKIGEGFKISFLNDEKIIYLKNLEVENKNIFYIFDLNENKFEYKIDKNIANYMKLSKDEFIIIEQNTHNKDYTLYKFNNLEKTITPYAKINNDKLFYDSAKEKGYISTHLPYDRDEMSIIYAVDLSKSDVVNNKN
ncbi:TolB family protein [Tepidimicrobium xylanilyticum]|uniref:TolB protein n=1 Tax=Tepidimicrobium xylanilyticum TaxID=1123352 RepID=A0A1H2V0E5_9FIRM|nr:hypothetical protein [Tepidimicrobium xylanilyticum]GMG96766.1 hypothetical protein EN5CB1_15920 [Tepidimicrobium xylanilyticum]SDW61788.1 hypothetical protein SAMN05660923_00981 [Tepidimicrobium xylanilyticum]